MEAITPKLTTACWVWEGELRSGYGRMKINGKPISAHRYSYELANGSIPVGLELDHLCRNRACTNPDHLEPVTHSENVRRGWVIRIENKVNCNHGHPLIGRNLYIVIDKRNGKTWRNCKQCKVEANRRWRKRSNEPL